MNRKKIIAALLASSITFGGMSVLAEGKKNDNSKKVTQINIEDSRDINQGKLLILDEGRVRVKTDGTSKVEYEDLITKEKKQIFYIKTKKSQVRDIKLDFNSDKKIIYIKFTNKISGKSGQETISFYDTYKKEITQTVEITGEIIDTIYCSERRSLFAMISDGLIIEFDGENGEVINKVQSEMKFSDGDRIDENVGSGIYRDDISLKKDAKTYKFRIMNGKLLTSDEARNIEMEKLRREKIVDLKVSDRAIIEKIYTSKEIAVRAIMKDGTEIVLDKDQFILKNKTKYITVIQNHLIFREAGKTTIDVIFKDFDDGSNKDVSKSIDIYIRPIDKKLFTLKLTCDQFQIIEEGQALNLSYEIEPKMPVKIEPNIKGVFFKFNEKGEVIGNKIGHTTFIVKDEFEENISIMSAMVIKKNCLIEVYKDKLIDYRSVNFDKNKSELIVFKFMDMNEDEIRNRSKEIINRLDGKGGKIRAISGNKRVLFFEKE